MDYFIIYMAKIHLFTNLANAVYLFILKIEKALAFILRGSIRIFKRPKVSNMKSKNIAFVLLVAACLGSAGSVVAQSRPSGARDDSVSIPSSERLVILWTSGDREVALKMVFMYTFNAQRNHWWKDITLVVWGPSAKLLSEDEELQEYMARIIQEGVTVKACKGCADLYGVSGKLEELGVTVLYIGKELTDYIKEGREILTI